jgi:hypothetical protein
MQHVQNEDLAIQGFILPIFETVGMGHLQPHFTHFGAHGVSPFSRRRDRSRQKKARACQLLQISGSNKKPLPVWPEGV